MIRRIVATLALVAITGTVSAREGMRPDDPIIAGIVAYSLENYHFAPQAVDDNLSGKWLDAWLDLVDSNKMYLLAEDIEQIEKYRTKLDDTLKGQAPDLEVAFEFDAIWQQRYFERLDFVERTLAEGLPEANEGAVDLDRTDEPWARSVAELDAWWLKRLQSEALRFRLQDRTQEEAVERLGKRFHRIRTDFSDRDAGDVMETWLAALGNAYDPHSVWFKPATQENFDISMRDRFQGIGARLQVDGEYTVVASLVAGGPAEKGNELKPQDRIVAVAQGDGESVDVIDMPLDKVVKLIRGEKGTTVVLTILPEDAGGPADTHDVRILRDEVVIEDASAESKVIQVDGKQVGVIELPSFYQDIREVEPGEWLEVRSTTHDVRRILGEFKEAGVDSVVLDLRYNTGGSLKQAIDLSGLFIASGPVVQVKDRQSAIEIHDDSDPALVYDGPLVVLVNEYSASASEILAGAIKDYGRGVVVGTAATFGKGTVQELVDLGPMVGRFAGPEAAQQAGALKITRQQFYRVSGRSTQNSGVVPDVLIPSALSGRSDRENDLPNALPYDEIAPASFQPWNQDLRLHALSSSSNKRIKASAAFQFLGELEAYYADAEGKPVSLSLAARQAEMKVFEELQEKGKKAGFYGDDVDPVLDETVLVARDLAG